MRARILVNFFYMMRSVCCPREHLAFAQNHIYFRPRTKGNGHNVDSMGIFSVLKRSICDTLYTYFSRMEFSGASPGCDWLLCGEFSVSALFNSLQKRRALPNNNIMNWKKKRNSFDSGRTSLQKQRAESFQKHLRNAWREHKRHAHTASKEAWFFFIAQPLKKATAAARWGALTNWEKWDRRLWIFSRAIKI